MNKKNKKSFFTLPPRLSLREQAMFAKRLSLLVRAGMPIVQSLNALKKQSRGGVKNMFEQISHDISNGMFLSKSLGRFKKVFGHFAINIIQVGEVSGTLSDNLQYLAIELDKKRELRGKIVSALVYPAVVLVASLAVTGMMVVFLFPKLLPVFNSLNAELPITTRALLVISTFLLNYWLWVVIGSIAGMIFIVTLIKKSKKIRYAFDTTLLIVPIIGPLFRNYHLANMCRTLGLLLKGQLSAVEAVGVAGDTCTHAVYQKELYNLRQALMRGSGIAAHLEHHPWLFQPVFTEMISVGEATGNLSDSLMYLAKICEQELDEDTKRLSSVIEPAMMIFMGLMVGFVAVSIITPIYEITQHLSR